MLQSIDTLIAFVVIMTVASLFVTILVQMCSAALSLRGKNLANALALTFQTIDPTIGDRAHQLAARILTDPLLSDSTLTHKDKRKALAATIKRKRPWDFWNIVGAMGLANAVRPEEVFAALQRMRDRREDFSRVAADLEDARAAVEQATARGEKHTAERRLEKAKAAVGAKPSAEEMALRETAAEILQALVRQEGPVSAHPAGEAEAARVKFETWFGSAQDRAQQWFQLHTRALTIAGSVLVALVLQLDAVEIFHFVSTSAAARAALVANANNVIEQADGALDEKGGLLQRIAAVATKPGQASLDLTGVRHTGDLEKRVAARDGAQFKAEDFDRLVAETTAIYYRDQTDKLADMTRGVGATGFEFIPIGYWRWPREGIVPHLPGMALFAALLTLGAPYWYNLLKNLASLRPAVAQMIGREDSAAAPAPK